MAKCTSNGTTPSANPARKRDQPEAVRVAGQQESNERQQREGAGQHDFIDRTVCPPVVRRHQFRRDGERRRDGKPQSNASDKPKNNKLLGGLRQRDQQCEQRADDHADLHDGLAAQPVGQRRGGETTDNNQERRRGDEPSYVALGEMQRLLRQHDQRTAERKVVALDEADRAEHDDQQYVVGTEGDTVELPPEFITGCFRGRYHGVLPD